MLIPSTITARRTRRYTSTWYIHPTTHKHDFEPMDGTGRYIFQPPQCQAVNPSRWSTLPPPFTRRGFIHAPRGAGHQLENEHLRLQVLPPIGASSGRGRVHNRPQARRWWTWE